MVLCASTAYGWVSFETFLDGGDVLKDHKAELKGALFGSEEMGVLLGNFAVPEKKRGGRDEARKEWTTKRGMKL